MLPIMNKYDDKVGLRFFRPKKSQLIIFFVLLLITYGGVVQSYVFSADQDFGVNKPFLYDLLSPFPFWLIFVVLIIPLLTPLEILLKFIMQVFDVQYSLYEKPFYWVIVILYMYLMSCIFYWVFLKVQFFAKRLSYKKTPKKIIY